MTYLNVEIKARCSDTEPVRNYLKKANARFEGLDRQTDTYFNVNKGRLKLREGDIENNLIWYDRNNRQGPKDSFFRLVKVTDPSGLKAMMESALGIKVTVRKEREIYYLQNVKFHIDRVAGLGCFIEIEAGNRLAEKTREELLNQCVFYKNELGIEDKDLVSDSYSDQLLKKEGLI